MQVPTARPAGLPRDTIVWLIAICALCAFVFLAIAEEGIDATELAFAPDEPLPFARHQVVGLDLSQYHSVDALNWLQASAAPRPWPLIVLPADEDVVVALAAEDDAASGAALQAIDSLMGATNGAPVAMCLRRPADDDTAPLAEAIFDTLATRYAGKVVYALACDAHDHEWQRQLSEAAPGVVTESGVHRLLPVAGAAEITLTEINPPPAGEALLPGDLPVTEAGYMAYQIQFSAPPAPDVVATFATTLQNAAHAALFLAQPARETNPTEFAAALGSVQMSGTTIPQGFSNVIAPGYAFAGTWQPEWVATTPFAVATGANPGTAELSSTALGTDISLVTVFGPDTGSINVWIDPPAGTDLPAPDATYSLVADQAQPVSLLIAQGLAAREHRIVIQALPDADGEIRIAGLFVTGSSGQPWTGFLAALALLAVGISALTERAWSAIQRIRATRPAGRRAGPLGRARYQRDR